MCRGRARLAGILKARQAERQMEQLYGAQGLVKVEYLGDRTGDLPATVHTGIRYPYYPGRKFYVDANDLSRVLSWQENGTRVFRQVQ